MTRCFHFSFLLACLGLWPCLHSAVAQHGIAALPESVNSKQQVIAPLRYAGQLYYTAVFQKDKKSPPVNRLWGLKLAGGEARLLAENPTDGNTHAANMALLPDASRMYYSVCEDPDVFHQDQCTLWYRDKTYEGSWGVAIKLPRHINYSEFTATQPAIGFDQSLKSDVLYFSSDRPGGKGGKDIWASILAPGGSFGEPVNLPFNTAGDEVTPFFEAGSQTLFFSSNGLDGLGGFDIYQTNKDTATAWGQPENLGELVNTGDDELYFTYHQASQLGYFSSNRPRAGGIPKGDVPGFALYEMRAVIEVELLVLDEETLIPVEGTLAEVWGQGAEHPLVFREQPFDEGLWMQLEGGREYNIIVRAKGYVPLALELDGTGQKASTCLKRKALLKKDGRTLYEAGEPCCRPRSQTVRFLNTSPKDFEKTAKRDLPGLPF